MADKDDATSIIAEEGQNKSHLRKILKKESIRTMSKDADFLRGEEDANAMDKISGEKNDEDAMKEEEEKEIKKTLEEAEKKKNGAVTPAVNPKEEVKEEVKEEAKEEVKTPIEEKLEKSDEKTDEEMDKEIFLKIKMEVEKEIGKEQEPEEEITVQKTPAAIEPKETIIEVKKEPVKEMSLKERRVLLNQELEKTLIEGQPTEDKKKKILIAINRLKKETELILEKESQAEDKKRIIEEEEKVAQSPSRKKVAEEKRWAIEEEREATEKERWATEAKINGLEEQLDTIDLENQKITEKKVKIEKELRKISLFEEKVETEKNIGDIEKKLLELEKEIEKLNKQERGAVIDLSQILKKEKEIEIKSNDFELKEKETTDGKSKEIIEKQRWETEKDRRETEKQKWQMQEKKDEIEAVLEKLRPTFQKLSNAREKLELQMKEVNGALSGLEEVRPEPKKVIEDVEKKTEDNPVEEIKPEAEEVRPEPEEVRAEPEEVIEDVEKKTEDSPIEETKEETLKTREKEQLLEEEGRKEFLKRFKNKLEERKEEMPIPPEEPKQTYRIPSPVFEPIERPSSFTKILIRGTFIFIVLSIIGALSWIFILNKKNNENVEKKEIPVATKEQKEEPKEEPASDAIFPVNETFKADVINNEDIIKNYEQFLTQKRTEGNFIRILLKNPEKKKWTSVAEISSAFQINIPAGISNKLESDFTIASYIQKQGERLALAIKIKKGESLTEEIKKWEKDIAINGLFINGKKTPAIATSFRDSTYKGVKIRFLTISTQDLGICYAIINDTLIVTSSYGSIEKIIENILANTANK